MRVPWTARRSTQSVPKEISPAYSLEELMLKLKLQYFDHLMKIIYLLEKTLTWERLKAGGEGDDRMRWLNSITDSMDMKFKETLGDSEGQGNLACCSPWGCKELDTTE